MHLFDPAVKFSRSGITGCRAASLRRRAGRQKLGKDWVAVSFFGEGGGQPGAFHEPQPGSPWKLPVIFVCEDNKYRDLGGAVGPTAIASNADRAPATACPACWWTTTWWRCSKPPARRWPGRAGGPTLIEVKTDRYLGHFQGDPETYRPENEAQHLRRARSDRGAPAHNCGDTRRARRRPGCGRAHAISERVRPPTRTAATAPIRHRKTRPAAMFAARA